MRRYFLIIAIAALFSGSSFALSEGPFRIEIENVKDGRISVRGEVVGRVLRPAKKLNHFGFTASLWAGTGEVAATSVNAIHVRASGRKTIFSIVPLEFSSGKKSSRSYFSSDSSVYTDIPAGTSIFGGGSSPYVGDRVLNGLEPLADSLKPGDTITIIVSDPAPAPRAIIFENRFGGAITEQSMDGQERKIGEVHRPVQGVGRFEGTLYLEPGRIRANHPGVIDISTSTSGQYGGFQIIPAFHAQSPEMVAARLRTQWMVVSNEQGSPPLFRSFLKPQYSEEDIEAPDWYERLLSRFLVDVKVRGDNRWRAMPVYGLLPGEDLHENANSFLRDVEMIRILFPH